MSDQSYCLEDKETKEYRKKVLENASQDCEVLQSEIKVWKSLKKDTERYENCIGNDKFSQKIAEIEKKIFRRKSESKETGGKSSFQKLDLEASLQASMLNQEILTKQYQLLLEKHELEVKDLKDQIISLNNQISDRDLNKSKDYEQNIFILKQEIANLTENILISEKKLIEKDKELNLLNIQVNDRDKVIKLLQEKVFSLENLISQLRENEFEHNSRKVYLEKEKKRREIAENEYKNLLQEVKALNERSCEEIRSKYEQKILEYKQIIDNFHINQLPLEAINPYENKCRDLTKTLNDWKEKVFLLTEKFFPALSSIKEQLQRFKQETITKQSKISKSYEKTISEISQKYNEALQASEKTLNFFKTKVESLENQKFIKIKTCKPN
jgi:hypothetical protein